MYEKETQMYPHVRKWLERLLKSKIKDAEFIKVYNSSNMKLTKLLTNQGLHKYFSSEYLTYDIKVDVTGIIVRRGRGSLIFIECKLGKITLKDFSQLLGYSIVAKPLYSIILSPKGISDSLFSLIKSFGRYDILKYHANREIALAKWDEYKKDIDYTTTIPPGWSIK